jgi:hypothetical protein
MEKAAGLTIKGRWFPGSIYGTMGGGFDVAVHGGEQRE